MRAASEASRAWSPRVSPGPGSQRALDTRERWVSSGGGSGPQESRVARHVPQLLKHGRDNVQAEADHTTRP